MRFLLANHTAYTDFTSGAMRSMRTRMEWLTQLGHECEVLTTARFDAKPPDSIEEHLASFDLPMERILPPKTKTKTGSLTLSIPVGRPVVKFTMNAVPVTMLLTLHNDVKEFHRAEIAQLLGLFEETIERFQPDALITHGGHSVVREFMRRARQKGIVNVFSLMNFGYDHPTFYENADYVTTCSQFLTNHYKAAIGLESVPITQPFNWDDIYAPDNSREYVTFVNPSRQKGVTVIARLALMLGEKRPDIQLLMVQSAADLTTFAQMCGKEVEKYANIHVAQAVAKPADYFGVTKILLAPSVFQEPFGRVAVEALINGVPALVSERGGLPEAVGDAGTVIKLPEWLQEQSTQIPSEEETLPWFEAICELWDNSDKYEQVSRKARETAERFYSESALKPTYQAFFGSLKPASKKVLI